MAQAWINSAQADLSSMDRCLGRLHPAPQREADWSVAQLVFAVDGC
jgi:hypothetical protein